MRRLAAAGLALLVLTAAPAAAADDDGRCPEPGTGRVVHCRHTVARGEWLWRIARTNLRQDFGQSRPADRTVARRAAEIRAYNPSVDADHLRPGQVLRLYPWVGAQPAARPGYASVGQHFADAQAVAIDPEGRIVTAGQLSDSVGVFRFHADTTLDTSFGSGGHVQTLVGTFARATGLAIQPDGRMVVTGATSPIQGSTRSDAFVLRYLPRGAADTAFGTPTIADASATGVALDAAGRIVVVGSSGDDVLVARFLPDGTADPTFGTAGVVRTDLGGTDVASAVAVDGAGRIVVAGTSQAAAGGNAGILLRYLPDGAADPAFPAVRTSRSPFDQHRAVQVRADGTIAVAGSRTTNEQTQGVTVLDHYDATGTLLDHREVGIGGNTFAEGLGLAGDVVVGRVDGRALVVDAAGQPRFAVAGAARSTYFAATVDRTGHLVAAGCTCDGTGAFGRGGREIPSSVVVGRY
jgi:uncharacterized delta-60 repeat protein